MRPQHHPSPLQAPPPWRACQLCTHGTGPEAARMCTAPSVATATRRVSVELARANTGPCGPEAVHLHFPGLTG